MYDAIVIGGGVVGASTAYHLAKSGANTLLIDKHHVGRATDAGAGILSAITGGTTANPAWFAFGIVACDYYPTLIAQLEREQDGDTGYAVCGLMNVAITEDEVDAYNRARDVIFARQQQRGTPSADELHEVTADEAQKLFPPLAAPRAALYYKDGARVDGRLLTAALLKAAQAYPLTHNASTVDQLIVTGGRVTGVVADGETFSAGKVIIAGGAWTSHFGDQLGVQIPVVPQRGQIIHLDLPGVDTSNWTVISAFHGHYMVPWADSRVVVGATRELGVGFSSATTITGMQEVFAEALRVAPGLANAQFREIRVGIRPYTADYMPVLGSIPSIEGVFLATGHGASGLQLGPYSGKLAADWALDQPLATDISAFDVTRFPSSR